MPGSTTTSFHSVRLTEITPLEERKVTRFVFEVPHTEQNRVFLQTVDSLREQASGSLVAIAVTVPDHLSDPPPRS
jgi:hypothetical protein